MISIKVADVKNVIRNIEAKFKEIKQAAKQGVTEVSLDLCGKSKQLAPVDTGDLRGSGYAKVDDVPTGIKGEVGFVTPYALVQHETLWFRHPKGGQAKYLEQPTKENESKYKQHIADNISRVLK
jgi:hypothetical protein